MKNFIKIVSACAVIAITAGSCSKDLNLTPTNDITADIAYKDFAGYKSSLAKVYGSYATTGSSGAGSTDLKGSEANVGAADFLRQFWNAQEITTDEAVCAWLGDPAIGDLDQMTWTSGNVYLQFLYTRSLYQITLVNEFIRESTDAKLNSRGITGNDAAEVKHFVAEGRFLRAFQYWVLMDLYGNPPFITENDQIGKVAPKQIKRADLFAYIESELKAIEGDLKAPRQNEYGRADQAAAWALLARMYLNAETYLGAGNKRYQDARIYAKKVIDAGYSLKSNYSQLFLADNDKNNNEVILSINYDGLKTQGNGGTTFLVNAAIDKDMGPASFGIPNGGWGGNRSRKNLPLIFGDYSGNTDKRALFQAGGKLEIEDISVFKQGLAITKFRNVTSTGTTPPSTNGEFCSIDFPLFRLSEMYLIYAEAEIRDGGLTSAGIEYFNKLRERAYGNTSRNVSSISLNDILDERARELYWEGFRRTDLIRFGKYTDASYLWPFKGGVPNGRAVESYRTLFPIPSSDVIANPNLTQNQGY